MLLKYREHITSDLLDQWADARAKRSRQSHRVPAATIRKWMDAWRSDLTIEDILRCE